MLLLPEIAYLNVTFEHFGFGIIDDFFPITVNMGPYDGSNFEVLLLSQIAFDFVQTSPEFSYLLLDSSFNQEQKLYKNVFCEVPFGTNLRVLYCDNRTFP